MNDPTPLWPQSDAAVPRHVAVIMDGNGRWAKQRGLPRTFGHSSGARQVKALINHCADRGVAYLTLFAFSSENWKRPAEEVSSLMSLFVLYLEKEIRAMRMEGVRLKVIGDISRFDTRLRNLIADAQRETADNKRITVTVAANYGGRWDLVEAVRRWHLAHPGRSADALSEEDLTPFLSMAHAPDPDLLIRTGGESRISNFLLWQLAYAELYFSDVLWPDFSIHEMDRALAWFADKDRRFGGVTDRVAN
ncbi:MAG: polyprenyl diphosphate synthase [Betaproteobacteria bacterium]